MKNKIYTSTLIVLFLILNGCYLKSVQPLVKENESIEVPKLAGSWQDDDQRWTFVWDVQSLPVSFKNAEIEITFLEKPDSIEDYNCDDHLCGYLVIHEDMSEAKIDSSLFLGNFIELDGRIYMDLYPVDLGNPSLKNFHYMSVHTFSWVEVNNDSLSIRMFKAKWIEDQIMKNRVRIKHEKLDDGVLITAPTDELQKFIIKYGRMSEAYEKPWILSRSAD